MKTLHTGGAFGADLAWEQEALKLGFKVFAYSFVGHTTNTKCIRILNNYELQEGTERAREIGPSIGRDFDKLQSSYVKNLISRNWFQVKNSNQVIAISVRQTDKIVKGGTGWAVGMAIKHGVPVFLFDQNVCSWFTFDTGRFRRYDKPIKLAENFAGIGKRDISLDGYLAIKKVLRENVL